MLRAAFIKFRLRLSNSRRVYKSWYWYNARATGWPKLNDGVGYNTVVHQGWWGPLRVQYYLAGVNITQTEEYWREVPDSNSTYRAPIISCPGITGYPPDEQGAWCSQQKFRPEVPTAMWYLL